MSAKNLSLCQNLPDFARHIPNEAKYFRFFLIFLHAMSFFYDRTPFCQFLWSKPRLSLLLQDISPHRRLIVHINHRPHSLRPVAVLQPGVWPESTLWDFLCAVPTRTWANNNLYEQHRILRPMLPRKQKHCGLVQWFRYRHTVTLSPCVPRTYCLGVGQIGRVKTGRYFLSSSLKGPPRFFVSTCSWFFAGYRSVGLVLWSDPNVSYSLFS